MKRAIFGLNSMLMACLLLAGCGSDEKIIEPDPGEKTPIVNNTDIDSLIIDSVCIGTVKDTGYVRYIPNKGSWYIESVKPYVENWIEGGIFYFVDSLPQRYKVEGKKVALEGNLFKCHYLRFENIEGQECYYVELKHIGVTDPSQDPTPTPNPGVIYDFAPIELTILIKNTEGTDMLNPEKEDTFLKDIVVTYKGKDYTIKKSSRSSTTREYAPTFYGLMNTYYRSFKSKYDTGLWCVIFGEFDRTENVKDREIVFSLGKDSTYQKIPISYSNEFSWDENHEPRIVTDYFVNGERVTDESAKHACFHFIYKETGELEYLPSEYE